MLRIIILLLSFVVGHAHAGILYTDFTEVEEGHVGQTFTDGGIIFSELDMYLNEGPIEHFAVDKIDPSLSWGDVPTDSQLSFGFYSTDSYLGESRFGSAVIDFEGEIANGVEIVVFDTGRESWNVNANILTLEALFDGDTVASEFVEFENNGGLPRLQTLSLNGVIFDSLRLVASGPEVYSSNYWEDMKGPVFMGIDSVMINTGSISVSEPSTLMLFSIVALFGFRRSKVKS